jgi:hypothetical protein
MQGLFSQSDTLWKFTFVEVDSGIHAKHQMAMELLLHIGGPDGKAPT